MIKPRLEGLTPRDMTSSFLFTSFGEVTKLLPAPYVFMISPRVVGKNDLWRDQPPYYYIDITPSYRQGPYGHLSKTWTESHEMSVGLWLLVKYITCEVIFVDNSLQDHKNIWRWQEFCHLAERCEETWTHVFKSRLWLSGLRKPVYIVLRK